MIVLLALVAGGTMGFALERGDMCFHSTWRGLMSKPRSTRLATAYVFYLVLSIPVIQALITLNVITPWTPALAWKANIAGGLVFGLGMVIASTCVTGMFYKLGRGMFGTLVAISGWAVGDVLTYRGPLSSLRDNLIANPVLNDGENATLTNSLGPTGSILVAITVALALAYFGKTLIDKRSASLSAAGSSAASDSSAVTDTKASSTWNWYQLGFALTLVGVVGWLLVSLEGSDYSFGTSGVPTQLWDTVRNGTNSGSSWWITLALLAITGGAYVSAKSTGTVWVRGESIQRYMQLGFGGLVMGVGAAIAGGCNLGHSLIGVPILSLGSITSTIAMIAGVYLGHIFLAKHLAGMR